MIKNMLKLSLFQGIFILSLFAFVMFFVTWFFSKGQTNDKETFLIANRRMGSIVGAFSIAATWTWAPAVLVSAQKGYQQGLAGAFWFVFPNVITLIIFAFFATKLRDKMPDGYTLPDYMGKKYGKRVHILYTTLLLCLQPMCFAVQLLAGGKLVSYLTGIDYTLVTVLLTLIVLAYSLFSGLKASFLTDFVQMLFMLIMALVVTPWAVVKAGGLKAITVGLGGLTGNFGNLFSSDGLQVFYSFGIVSLIGLLAGPFGDQLYWHRVFAIEQSKVKKSFVLGGIFFATIPITMSILGFVGAYGQMNGQWNINDPSIVNLEVIGHLLPLWAVGAFLLMLISALTSTMDSSLCAISSLISIDVMEYFKRSPLTDKNYLQISRLTMVIFSILGIVIANIPGLQLVYFFLFYAILRSSTLFPTLITILTEKAHESGVFYGILASIILGMPIYAYGTLSGKVDFTIVGSILAVVTSGLVCFTVMKVKSKTSGVRTPIEQ